MKPKEKAATIIVLTASLSSERTKRCLESVERYTKLPYELFVVKDDKSYFGFSRENNRLMRIAEGKYIVLLNDDCFVTEGWLEKMIQAAESGKDVGIVGARLYLPDGTLGNKEDLKPGEVAREVEDVAFALVLMNREAVQRVGYLDELFTFGLEDKDYCIRAKLKGFRVVTSQATATHLVNTSTRNLRAIMKKQRGWVILCRRYGTPLWRTYSLWLWLWTYPIRFYLKTRVPRVSALFRNLKFLTHHE